MCEGGSSGPRGRTGSLSACPAEKTAWKDGVLRKDSCPRQPSKEAEKVRRALRASGLRIFTGGCVRYNQLRKIPAHITFASMDLRHGPALQKAIPRMKKEISLRGSTCEHLRTMPPPRGPLFRRESCADRHEIVTPIHASFFFRCRHFRTSDLSVSDPNDSLIRIR